MIKTLLSLISFICVSVIVFAQPVHSIYITGDGVKSTDPTNADSYLLIQEQPQDSIWFVRQYNMNNLILTNGYYKDEQMTIPHGTFSYYKFVKAYEYIKYDFLKRKYDTTEYAAINYIDYTGNFFNGKKTGKWFHYNSQGKVIDTYTFQDDRMEGLCRNFDPENGFYVEGRMVNGQKEGNWNLFTPRRMILRTEVYSHGMLNKVKSHLSDKEFRITEGKPNYDVADYLNHIFSQKHPDTVNYFKASYYFIITKDGNLTEPNVLRKSILSIDISVIDALMHGPKWNAPIHNKQPVDAQVTINIGIRVDSDKKVHISLNNPDESILLYPVEDDLK
jgi:antitoxin component YwqK of YwqJK toxin-antitoxin module